MTEDTFVGTDALSSIPGAVKSGTAIVFNWGTIEFKDSANIRLNPTIYIVITCQSVLLKITRNGAPQCLILICIFIVNITSERKEYFQFIL